MNGNRSGFGFEFIAAPGQVVGPLTLNFNRGVTRRTLLHGGPDPLLTSCIQILERGNWQVVVRGDFSISVERIAALAQFKLS